MSPNSVGSETSGLTVLLYTGSWTADDNVYRRQLEAAGSTLDDVVIGISFEVDFYIPRWFGVLEVEFTPFSFYLDPIHGDYAGNVFDAQLGVGLGVGASLNMEFIFSQDADPTDLAFSGFEEYYEYIEIDTPVADFGMEGHDDEWTAWTLGFGPSCGGGVSKGKGICPAPEGMFSFDGDLW